MTSSASEIGRVRKTVQSPWLMVSAWRIACSAMGPRIMPITTGAVGKSKRRMNMPIVPIT